MTQLNPQNLVTRLNKERVESLPRLEIGEARESSIWIRNLFSPQKKAKTLSRYHLSQQVGKRRVKVGEIILEEGVYRGYGTPYRTMALSITHPLILGRNLKLERHSLQSVTLEGPQDSTTRAYEVRGQLRHPNEAPLPYLWFTE